ncbi:MAG TPA: farnesyl diphosphate synthase [Candidatus Didemnitutus sp.]|nr:farnesyl diphosphate synthase [Candidatus Didemnitutus sp.]
MDFTVPLQAYRDRVEEGLDALLPAAATPPARLHEAMRYSLQTRDSQAGGAAAKRLRPVLVLAAADLFGRRHNPLPAAVAIECIHTYSLVHDDLPCMDNDDLRRGRPTAHRKFDEATALLAGDALLTFAFQLVGRHYGNAPILAARLTQEIADAAGSERLIGGQMADLLAEKKADATPEELDFIHLNKTAAMISVSLAVGGLCSGASEAHVGVLRDAGRHLGLAFQIVDDLLDATTDSATLGKTAGKDAKSGKTTYVKLHGLEASRRFARNRSQAALTALEQLPADLTFLSALVESMAARSK